MHPFIELLAQPMQETGLFSAINGCCNGAEVMMMMMMTLVTASQVTDSVASRLRAIKYRSVLISASADSLCVQTSRRSDALKAIKVLSASST